MKTRTLIGVVAIAAAAGAAGYGLYWFGLSQGMKMTAPATPGTAATSASEPRSGSSDRRVLYWHDPMVPGTRFDKPGKSPFMDMQLVPVYADEATDDGKTTISPRVQQNLGIRTAEIVRGNLRVKLAAVGSIAYNDRDVALVQARNNGFVERLHVRAPLDPVKKGQPLVDLYVPDWVAAQEEFFSVKRMRGHGLEHLVDAARQRMRLAGMNDDQVGAVESGGTVQPRFTLTAPIGGVVTELMTREGMTVTAGASLFRINGTGTIWVIAEVPENVAEQVLAGTPVEVSTPALPGKVFKGRVSRILPEVNRETRTIRVRIELPNPSGQLAAGMFATVEFTSSTRNAALLVPTEAVIQTGTRTIVIVALGDGKFAPVDVEIGREANGQSEIRRGLEAGQRVVVSGQFLIDSEASLKASIARMGEPPATDSNPPSGGTTHRGEGKVESIGNNEVTLSHGPIPTLKWPPMTMDFKLPATGLPKNITVGDTVRFEMREVGQGEHEIVSIARAATSPPAHDTKTGGTVRMPGDSGSSGAKR